MSVARYHVTDLGTLGGPESRAYQINDSYQIIGSADTSVKSGKDWVSHPFLWQQGQMLDLRGFPAKGINNKGDMVATHLNIELGFGPRQNMYSMIYRGGRSKKLLPKFPFQNQAVAINDHGDVLGAWLEIKHLGEDKRKWIATSLFVWNNGSLNKIWRSESEKASPVDINNAGEIVFNRKASASENTLGAKHAVLLADSEMVELGSLPGYGQSTAVAINNHLQVLCRAIDSNMSSMGPVIRKLIDEDASMEESKKAISDFGPRFSQKSFLWDKGIRAEIDGLMTDINDHGQIVGWTGCSLDRPFHALTWQNGDLANLNDFIDAASGWRLDKASGINNHGQIVGHGKFDGVIRAFLLTPA